MKKIGIIGGAGVAATNKLNCMIEEYFTLNGAIRDCHHPEIITYQAVNVPSRSMFLEGRGESFIPGYIEIGKKLKLLDVDIICMSCNTAHYAIDILKNEIELPFINMVDLVAKEVLMSEKNNKIGLIASDGCILGKVYEKYLNEYLPNSTIIYPDKQTQSEVTKGICNIKNTNRFLNENNSLRPKSIFLNVCNHLTDAGADIIISGCTDIAVDFLPEDFEQVKVIDSLTVLAKAIIKEYLK